MHWYQSMVDIRALNITKLNYEITVLKAYFLDMDVLISQPNSLWVVLVCLSLFVVICFGLSYASSDTLEHKTSLQGKLNPDIFGSDIDFLNFCVL